MDKGAVPPAVVANLLQRRPRGKMRSSVGFSFAHWSLIGEDIEEREKLKRSWRS